MVKINWNDGEQKKRLYRKGNYLAEITGVRQKASSKGDQMFVVQFASIEHDGAYLATDYIMLEGKGIPMGVRKLKALGFDPKKDDDINPATMIGRRVYVAIGVDEYKGEVVNRIDGSAKGSKAGYWPEKSPPDQVVTNAQAPIDNPTKGGDDDENAPF